MIGHLFAWIGFACVLTGLVAGVLVGIGAVSFVGWLPAISSSTRNAASRAGRVMVTKYDGSIVLVFPRTDPENPELDTERISKVVAALEAAGIEAE